MQMKSRGEIKNTYLHSHSRHGRFKLWSLISICNVLLAVPINVYILWRMASFVYCRNRSLFFSCYQLHALGSLCHAALIMAGQYKHSSSTHKQTFQQRSALPLRLLFKGNRACAVPPIFKPFRPRGKTATMTNHFRIRNLDSPSWRTDLQKNSPIGHSIRQLPNWRTAAETLNIGYMT